MLVDVICFCGRLDLHNEEVEEPVGASGDSVGLASGLEGVNLSGVEPGERQPGSSERGNVGEETNKGSLGRSCILRVLATRDKAGEGEDHGKHLTSSSVKKKLSATDALNDEPRRGGEDAVDDHVDTAKKHSKVLVSKDLGAENGEVVDDGVATTNLLHELRTRAKQHTSEVLSLSTSEKRLDGSGLLTSEARCADGVEDRVSLLACIVAVNLVATDGGNDTLGVLVPLVGEEPSRALGKPDHGNAKHEAKDDLEGNGETPGEVLRSVRSTIVDPVGDEGTESNDTTLNADEQTTVASLTALSLVGRDSRSVDTVADSSDDTTDDELSKLGVTLDSRDLNDHTDDHDNASHDHSASSTEKITDPEDKHGSHQAANLVDGGDQPLDGLILGFREVIMKRVGVNNTTHNPLIESGVFLRLIDDLEIKVCDRGVSGVGPERSGDVQPPGLARPNKTSTIISRHSR